MIPLPAGRDWFGFVPYTQGDGALNIAGGVATMSSGADTGSARMDKHVKITPGETIRFSCFARLVSPSGLGPGIAIDYPATGTLQNIVLVDSTEWKEYSLAFSAPVTAAETDRAKVTAGVFSTYEGEAEFAFPRIESLNSQYGAPRVVAYALIQFTEGVPAVHESFVNSGIRDCSYDDETGICTITVDRSVDELGICPLFFAQMTLDGAPQIVAKAGQFDRDTGEIHVQFLDVTTGLFVDISELTPDVLMWFMAII